MLPVLVGDVVGGDSSWLKQIPDILKIEKSTKCEDISMDARAVNSRRNIPDPSMPPCSIPTARSKERGEVDM